MADAQIRAIITAEDKASATIKNFGKNVDSTSQDITGGINASMVAVGLATAGIVAFGKKALDAFNAQDLATVRLQTGINNVKSATDKHIDSLLKQASALQKTTRFSDEATISAQGILSTFQLNQKAITAITPRLQDMSEGLARVTGEMPDLESNAILVAKAIGGEDVAGLTGALRRAGVVMTKTQTDLLQTGTVEQRVAIITQVLDQNFKGMAESAGGTTAGKLAILKNQFNELEERIGLLIATALTPLLNLLIQHPAVLTAVTIAIGSLTAAFVAVKIAAAIQGIIVGLTGAYTVLAGAATAASLAIAAPLVLVIVGTAAIWAAYSALIALRDAWNAAAAASAQSDAMDNRAIKAIRDNPNLSQAQKSARIAGLMDPGYRAEGGPVTAGQPYIVGERRPELFVPSQNGTIIPKLPNGATYNITLQAGAYMGNPADARRYAQMIADAMKDLAGKKNMTASEMLS